MARVVVLHASHGCDTGCCGHVVEVDGQQVGRFNFSHPSSNRDDDIRCYARQLVTELVGAEHAADIDWGASIIVGD